MNDLKKKILAVDDDAANLALIQGILSSLYKVYPIDSGEDALEFLEMQHPDLILLDVEMPVMSGTELFGRIRENPKLSDIPVIYLTGNIDSKSEAEAFQRGAADFIRKPINDIVLLARVKMNLEYDLLRRLKRELLSL